MTRNRLDHLFTPFRMLDQMEREFHAARRAMVPVNVTQTDDSATATFELPGVDLDAIHVEVDGCEVTVSASRAAVEIGDGQWALSERSSGESRRTVRLPFEIDREQVGANYADGLLTVTLPRAEADKPARIAVTAG